VTKNEKKARLAEIVFRLRVIYPDAVCALEYEGDPWRLLVMARLSAQCTDARVNIVSRELFKKFPTAKSMADGDISEIEEIVKPCGLFRMKAKNIKDASAMLVNEYGGELPSDMDELLKFPGVGRKIANLLLGDYYGLPAIVCDTHCIRICGRFGMYPEKEKNPDKVEMVARHEVECTLEDIIAVSSKLLQTSGRLCMCHRPERLSELMFLMSKYKVEPKRLRLVCQRKGEEPWLVLVEGRRCGNKGLRIEPTLYIEENGDFSDEMIKIYGSYKEAYLNER
jgi:endonuclease-3